MTDTHARELHFNHVTGMATVQADAMDAQQTLTDSASQLEIDSAAAIHVLADGQLVHVESLADEPLAITLADQQGVETIRVSLGDDAGGGTGWAASKAVDTPDREK